jgi:uncharacterized protein (DUF2336 family)
VTTKPRPGPGDIRPGYEDEKRRAVDPDATVRSGLARGPAAPEILYYLASDASPLVRREIAANRHTPPQADLMLARDAEEMVRAGLAQKIAAALPGLSPQAQRQACRRVADVIEILARDEAVRVRQIIAEAIKDVEGAPPETIRRLARDTEIVVAHPVLRFSRLLTDEDLLEIIASPPALGARTAIAGRKGLAGPVADAIVGVEDEAAIAELLANPSAQIREATLDRIVALAPDHASWHPPLVERPGLSNGLVQRIAAFVADYLLRRLERREDLSPEARAAVAVVVRNRLSSEGPSPAGEPEKTKKHADPSNGKAGEPPGGGAKQAGTAEQVQQLHAKGLLDEAALAAALQKSDRAFVKAALTVLAKVPAESVDRMFTTRSAKGIVSLVWKAGLSPRLAMQVQLRLAGIPFQQVLAPRDEDWPLRPAEMEWHLEFFGVGG